MVKPRENRVPIMMSEEELRAIDDWRFANRVATRSEAIRRLCQIGFLVGQEMDGLSDITLNMSEALSGLEEETFYFWGMVADPSNKGDQLNRVGVLEMLEGILGRVEKIESAASDLSNSLVALFAGTVGLTNRGPEEGRKVAQEAMDAANERLGKIRDLREEKDKIRDALKELSYKNSDGKTDEDPKQ